MMTEEERKRNMDEARAQLAQTDQLLKNRAEERARREKADADRKRGIIGNVQRDAADDLVEAGAKRQPMALTGQDAEEYFKERDNLKSASAAAGKTALGAGEDRLGRLETRGRQNVIDLKNRQAHDAINAYYGPLIRQGKASPFHALAAHEEQRRRYEEKTRLQGDYDKLKQEQDEKQKAAQAAAEDLHKRMGSSTFAVFTALDRLNDPDLSDSERASTLSVAAAAAQKLGDQFVENKFGADSGYRSEVVKVEGENPATGRTAVGYEIMVKDRNGNPVMDYRTGRPLVMKLDADRARKAMEQHFGYEFQTDEDGKRSFSVNKGGGELRDGRFSFGRQDFGSMQVGDRLFGGQYSAKTRDEMDKQARERQQAEDAHALAEERIESSKSARRLAGNADARAAAAADRDERMATLKEEAQRLQNQYEQETMPDRKRAVQKQIEQIEAQIDHLTKSDELAGNADARAAAESAARVKQIQAETRLTEEKVAQLQAAAQAAKESGKKSDVDEFVLKTASDLVKDQQFRANYDTTQQAADAAREIARRLVEASGPAQSGEQGKPASSSKLDAYATGRREGERGASAGAGTRTTGGGDDLGIVKPNPLKQTGGVIKTDDGAFYYDKEDIEDRFNEETGQNDAVPREGAKPFFVSKTELPKVLQDVHYVNRTGIREIAFRVPGADSPADGSAQETVIEILDRMGYQPPEDGEYFLTEAEKRKLDKWIRDEKLPPRPRDSKHNKNRR